MADQPRRPPFSGSLGRLRMSDRVSVRVKSAQELAERNKSEPNLDDVDEGEDIVNMHAQAIRERSEPAEGNEAAPLFVWVIVFAVLGASLYYQGRYGGSFDPIAHPEVETAAVSGGAVEPPNGSTVFLGRCASCHQPTGTGAGNYPPLAGSEWVQGDEETVVKILLKGLGGELTVAGKPFGGAAMPSWGEKLTDAEIAAVLTYVRSSWGNKASPIDAALVGKVRGEVSKKSGPWTAAELKK